MDGVKNWKIKCYAPSLCNLNVGERINFSIVWQVNRDVLSSQQIRVSQ
jgi:hypothetical protein